MVKSESDIIDTIHTGQVITDENGMGWILYGKQIQKTNRYMWRNHSFNYWHKDYM